MVNRIGGGARPAPRVSDSAAAGANAGPGRAFDVNGTAAPAPGPTETARPSNPTALGRVVQGLEQQREAIDRAIERSMGGHTFSPAELLLLQSRVYSYSQQMEVVSRMVDRTVSALKTTLNTQL